MDMEVSTFTAEDRKALTGLVIEVRLRFDSLDSRLARFESRLGKVEENAVMRIECGRVEHETQTRLDRVEQLKIDGETLRALEQRVDKLEADRASRADVNRAESAAEAARAAVEQAKTDLQVIKTRLAYAAGGLAVAVGIIEFAFKYLLK